MNFFGRIDRAAAPASASTQNQIVCGQKEEAMPIPAYQTLMLPLLKLAGDGMVHSKRDTVPELASQFGLTEDEQKELLPSGKQEVFDNRVGWARTYLKKALRKGLNSTLLAVQDALGTLKTGTVR